MSRCVRGRVCHDTTLLLLLLLPCACPAPLPAFTPAVRTPPGTRQVMGPNDGYICQFARDCNIFWAERNTLELGATFRGTAPSRVLPRAIVPQVRDAASLHTCRL